MNAPQHRRGVTAMMASGLALPMPPRISINGARFTLVDRAGNELMCNLVDPQLGHYLDVIIVDANQHKSKILYEADWTPQSNDPPICWSDNGVAPSQSCMQPQAPTCSPNDCQWNRIGSDQSKLTGKPIKACQDRKKLAVLVVGMPPELYQFQTTPASLKHLAAYAKWVSTHPNKAGTGPADVSEIVTRLYFLAGQQGVVGFASVDSITPDMDARIDALFSSGATREITGADDVPISGLLAAPQRTQQIEHTPAAGQWPQQGQPPVALPAPAAPPPQPQWGGHGAAAQPPQPSWPAPAAPGYAQPQPGGSPAAQPAQHHQAPPPPAQFQMTAAQPIAPAPDPFAVPGFLQRTPNGQPPAQQPANQAPQGFAPPAQAPGKPRGGARQGAGRKKADTQPQQQGFPAPAAAPQPQQAPFMQQGGDPSYQPPGQPVQPQPAPAPQFGMAPAGVPTADMSAALDRAFSAPIPGR